MTINEFLFAIDIIGVFLSLGFISYEIRTDRKRWAEERRRLVRVQRTWQHEGAARCRA